ncbi:alpha/beta fold hydrolase [Actinomycetospora chlora]|uniref:alpha/beta fold hydrolase n=1 Tax=Actinomycetospora chlora TaxID=663608 RepID=UPI0031E68EC2
MGTSSLRRHLRELHAALRVLVCVLVTLLLASVRTGRPDEEHGTPVASARTLVVLVHGFGAGSDCWDAVAGGLGGPAVAVVRHRYRWTRRVDGLGAELADRVLDLAAHSGARTVTLVGHSLGGVVVAAALADPRLAGVVTHVVTVAAPLHGTGWARLFPVGAVRDLRRGRLPDTAPVPWTTLASRTDAVVTPAAATTSGADAVLLDGVGHCGLLRDPRVVARIAELAAPTDALALAA